MPLTGYESSVGLLFEDVVTQPWMSKSVPNLLLQNTCKMSNAPVQDGFSSLRSVFNRCLKAWAVKKLVKSLFDCFVLSQKAAAHFWFTSVNEVIRPAVRCSSWETSLYSRPSKFSPAIPHVFNSLSVYVYIDSCFLRKPCVTVLQNNLKHFAQ